MHTQTQSVPKQKNICRWNPEFATRRRIRYQAQDTPIWPRNVDGSAFESIEQFLIMIKPRLEPTQYTYESLKSFLEEIGGAAEPSPIPDSRKLVLVDDRRRCDDFPNKPEGLDISYESLSVAEFWEHMMSTVSLLS